MDSFAELIRNISQKGRRVVSGLPNTDPLSSDSVTDIRNKKADRVLLDAAAKSEKAFNSALNSYFKKFGLKYKNGKLTSPSVEKAFSNLAKKAQSNGMSADTLTGVINLLNNNKSGVSVGTGINGANPNSKIPNTNPLSTDSITDIRNVLGK